MTARTTLRWAYPLLPSSRALSTTSAALSPSDPFGHDGGDGEAGPSRPRFIKPQARGRDSSSSDFPYGVDRIHRSGNRDNRRRPRPSYGLQPPSDRILSRPFDTSSPRPPNSNSAANPGHLNPTASGSRRSPSDTDSPAPSTTFKGWLNHGNSNNKNRPNANASAGAHSANAGSGKPKSPRPRREELPPLLLLEPPAPRPKKRATDSSPRLVFPPSTGFLPPPDVPSSMPAVPVEPPSTFSPTTSASPTSTTAAAADTTAGAAPAAAAASATGAEAALAAPALSADEQDDGNSVLDTSALDGASEMTDEQLEKMLDELGFGNSADVLEKMDITELEDMEKELKALEGPGVDSVLAVGKKGEKEEGNGEPTAAMEQTRKERKKNKPAEAAVGKAAETTPQAQSALQTSTPSAAAAATETPAPSSSRATARTAAPQKFAASDAHSLPPMGLRRTHITGIEHESVFHALFRGRWPSPPPTQHASSFTVRAAPAALAEGKRPYPPPFPASCPPRTMEVPAGVVPPPGVPGRLKQEVEQGYGEKVRVVLLCPKAISKLSVERRQCAARLRAALDFVLNRSGPDAPTLSPEWVYMFSLRPAVWGIPWEELCGEVRQAVKHMAALCAEIKKGKGSERGVGAGADASAGASDGAGAGKAGGRKGGYGLRPRGGAGAGAGARAGAEGGRGVTAGNKDPGGKACSTKNEAGTGSWRKLDPRQKEWR